MALPLAPWIIEKYKRVLIVPPQSTQRPSNLIRWMVACIAIVQAVALTQ